METWQKIGTLAALATIGVGCSEDTIINVDDSTNTIQYVDTSKISEDTIKMLIKEKQLIDSILSEQQKKIDQQGTTIERQGMSLDSLKMVVAQLEEYSAMLAGIIDNNNRRQNETNAQQDSKMAEIEKKLNDMDRQSQIPEQMSDKTREAFGWAMRHGIYDVGFETTDNNIAFNDKITKHLLTNIVYKFVQYFGISSVAGKDDTASEFATWEDFIKMMIEYGKDDTRYENFFHTLKYSANEAMTLEDVLKCLKEFAEYVDLKGKYENETYED